MSRGDVWWYEPPDSKRRPYLMLTRGEVAPLLLQVLAVPATSRARGLPTEVAVGPADGMPRSGVLNLDAVNLIEPVYCTALITQLGVRRMREVCEALRIATAC